VQFEVEAGESVEVEDDNCSICRMTGFLHLVVPQTALRLLMGAEFLTVFRFNAHVAEYTFGEICGIKLF
jgi:hypothetical protein